MTHQDGSIRQNQMKAKRITLQQFNLSTCYLLNRHNYPTFQLCKLNKKTFTCERQKYM